jgi:hypothetical protein
MWIMPVADSSSPQLKTEGLGANPFSDRDLTMIGRKTKKNGSEKAREEGRQQTEEGETGRTDSQG